MVRACPLPPSLITSYAHALVIARALRAIKSKLNVGYFFRSFWVGFRGLVSHIATAWRSSSMREGWRCQEGGKTLPGCRPSKRCGESSRGCQTHVDVTAHVGQQRCPWSTGRLFSCLLCVGRSYAALFRSVYPTGGSTELRRQRLQDRLCRGKHGFCCKQHRCAASALADCRARSLNF